MRLTVTLFLLLASVAQATITLSTTTRAGTSATGAGTDIDCRGPCPVVVDAGSGTTTTHSTGDAGQVGIRFGEKKITGCTYDHDTGGGAGILPSITCRDLYSDLETDGNEAEWTASADAGAYFYVGAGLLGQPTTVRAAGTVLTVGTCGSLANGQWGYCNRTTVEGSGGFAVYVQVALGDPDGQAAGYVDSYRGLFTTMSWELTTVSTSGGTDWTEGSDAINEFFHDGGTEVHGKPIGVRIAEGDASEGTCCALAAGQWGWCNPSVCNALDVDANRIMVRLSDDTDPDANPTGTVKIIYGDGEYIEVSHSTWNSGNPQYKYVYDKTSDDTIVLADSPSGSDSDETTVTAYQAVNPWTDLRFNYSVSCPNGGGNCIEDITNGDQRPSLTTTAIDETVGRGPIWAFVFKEGFGADAVITITANDDANGDTQDSQTIDVDETAWTGGAEIRYVASTGDDSDGTTLAKAWLLPEECINWLGAAAAGSECVFLAGDTTTMVSSSSNWAAVTGDRRIRSSVAGTKAIVAVPNSVSFLTTSTTTASGDLSIMDIEINKTGANTSPISWDVHRSAVLRVDVSCSGALRAWATGVLAPANDIVFWDSTFQTNTTGTGVYPMYSPSTGTGTPENDVKRRVWIGNYFEFNNGEHVFRAWPNTSVMAYNRFEHDGTPSATKNNMKLLCGTDSGVDFTSQYVYIYANYIYQTSTNVTHPIQVVDLDHDTGNNIGHYDYLFDSNYIENQLTATTPAHTAFNLKSGKNLLFKNNVIDGFANNVNASTLSIGGQNTIRLFNNDLYTVKATTVNFTKDGGGGSDRFANLKVINNAGLANSSTAGNIIQNNSTVGTIESTQILENVWDWGTVTSAWDVDTASGGFTGAGWPAQSMKAAQLNYTGNQGKDNDPLFALPGSNDFRLCTGSGVPDVSCSGASPCIDVGYDLPTVYYDYSGAVRNSDDIGAWDDDSVGSGSIPVSTLSLLGVGK